MGNKVSSKSSKSKRKYVLNHENDGKPTTTTTNTLFLTMSKRRKVADNEVVIKSVIMSMVDAVDADQIPNYSEFTQLSQFGYEFNPKGQLRQIGTGKKFSFEVHGKGKTSANQKRYEALGEVITLEVFKLLENEPNNLQRIMIPFDGGDDEPKGFIFASDNARTADNLLVLIHGSGVVRAGQWARRLIINDNIESGTQIPYIQLAKERGWGVVVLNTNYNTDPTFPHYQPNEIRGSETPERHGVYVWGEYIADRCDAKRIAIVAHSAGGFVTSRIAHEFPKDFASRVKAVAFTDSFCEPNNHIMKVGRNWVTSEKPLNTLLSKRGHSSHIASYAAGTQLHEETSHTCRGPLWEYLDKMMSRNEEDDFSSEDITTEDSRRSRKEL